jgi:hypothetical protein
MTAKLKQRIGIVIEDTDFNRRAAAYAKKAAKQAAALKYRRRKAIERLINK